VNCAPGTDFKETTRFFSLHPSGRHTDKHPEMDRYFRPITLYTSQTNFYEQEGYQQNMFFRLNQDKTPTHSGGEYE